MVVVLAKKLARDTAAAAAVGKSRWKTEKHVAGKRQGERVHRGSGSPKKLRQPVVAGKVVGKGEKTAKISATNRKVH